MPESRVRLVTLEQGAEYLGISRSFMFELISKGEVKKVKIGRASRVDLHELDIFIEQKKNA